MTQKTIRVINESRIQPTIKIIDIPEGETIGNKEIANLLIKKLGVIKVADNQSIKILSSEPTPNRAVGELSHKS